MREKIEELYKSLPKNLLQKVTHLKNSVPIEELHTWSQGLEGSKLISDIWEVAKILTEISTVNKGVIGIYKITSPSNKVYVGQAKCINLRWKKYKSNLAKGQTRLHNSFSKYGTDKHKFEIIEVCEQEDLDTKERYWQEHYNVLGEKGLNCLLVSTQQHKQCIAKDTRIKRSKSLRNKVLSEATLEKLGISIEEYGSVTKKEIDMLLGQKIGKLKSDKTRDCISTVIETWNFDVHNKITIKAISSVSKKSESTIKRHWKNFKKVVAELNDNSKK